jgi:hypothetical protein
MQRPLNSATPKNIARDGAPKNSALAPVVTGQKRQTAGDVHPFLHGQAMDDSAPTKAAHSGKSAPVHPSAAKR